MKVQFLIILVTCMLNACMQSENVNPDLPPMLYAQPQIIRFPAKQPYLANVLTGDSILPYKDSKGQPAKTGVPVPADMSVKDTGFLSAPVSVPAQWLLIDTLESNSTTIKGKPDTISIDEDKLIQVLFNLDSSSAKRTGSHKDSVITGVRVPAIGEVVPCRKPAMKKLLPMSVRPGSRYNMKELNAFHGFSSSNVFHVMEDRKGNLWFSTFDGLICFDGQYSQTFGVKNGLMADLVFYSFEDSKGNIWIYSGAKGISCYDGNRFTHYKNMKLNAVGVGGSSGFTEDKHGNVWMKNLVNGITRFDGKYFTHFTKKEGMRSNGVRGLMSDSKNRVWIGSRNGISIFDESKFIHLTKADGLNHDVVSCFTEDRKGNIWIGTDSGVAVYNGKSLVRFTKNNGLSGDLVSDIEEDRNGNIWISTYESGVTRFDGNTFTVFGVQEGIADNKINNIAIDKNGVCWFVSFKGVTCYHENNVTRLVNFPGYAQRNINGLIVENDGSLIIGDKDKGLYKATGNLLYKLADADSIDTGYINPMFVDKDGQLWFYIRKFGAPLQSGLACFTGNNIKFYRSRSSQVNDFVRSVTADRKGRLMIGTTRGVLYLNGDNMEWLTKNNGLLSDNVFRILESKDGSAWIASFDGLTKFKDSVFTHYTEYEGLPGRMISNIVEDVHGGVWMSSNTGIGYLLGNEMMLITDEQGATSGKSYLLKGFDKNKNIWFNSNNGISRIPANYFQSVKNDEKNRKGILRITEKDGLYTPLMILGNIIEDKVFIHSINSYETSVLNISNLDSSYGHASAVLKNWILNNNDGKLNLADSTNKKTKSTSESKPFYNLPESAVLPYDQNNITFQFSLSGDYTNDQVYFSYKLAGLDQDWSDPSQEPAARYPYVPPGKYTFMVRAIDRHQQWGPAAEFAFTIRKPFWLTWWFMTMLSLLIGGIIYYIINKRISAIRQRESEKTAAQQMISELEYKSKKNVLDERLRISAELHDEVGATLSGISMYSHLAKEQMKGNESPEIKNSLNVIQHNAGEMVNKLNDIVWLINPGNDNLQQLLQRLEDYAVQMAAVKNIRVRSNINGHYSKSVLPAEIRRNIYLLFKEAINNAVKYSNASQFDFTITEGADGITIHFSDNGQGYKPDEVKPGNGLRNMMNRAKEINAELLITGSPGQGTTVHLYLPQRGIEKLN
ncbi:MAG TPA: hypothetical protein DHV26_01455 [Cytophagales bacterium]|nr:hypothetical protein [Cytophagales bacterium]